MVDAFAATHRWDRRFLLAFVVVAWAAIAMGFTSQIQLRFTGRADYPPPAALVIHVWAFFGWLALLSVQLSLSYLQRLHWHRTLGLAAIVLVPIMAWSAIAAEVYSERFYSPVDPDVIRFFPVPVTNVACFVACAVAAILLRRRAAAHKRLIYLATSNVLVAAFFRWWADGIYAALPPGLATEWLANYVGVALLLAAAVAYDLASGGTVHRVYRVAIPLILAAQLTSVLIGQSDWWPAVGRNLLGIA
jgi:hypothetical protein